MQLIGLDVMTNSRRSGSSDGAVGFGTPIPNFSLNAGQFNLLDKKYGIAQDVVGVTATSPQLELYTQPGLAFAVDAVVRW